MPKKEIAVQRNRASRPVKKTTSPSKPATRSSASTTPSPPTARVMMDHQRRTCIELDRGEGLVKFIALSVEDGLEVSRLPQDQFDDRYSKASDYPAEKAAKLYVSYSRSIGASEDALNFLKRLTNVSDKEFQMATAKKAAKAATKKAAPAAKTTATKAATKTADTPAKKAASKVPATPAKKAAAGKKEPGVKRDSAAQMFKDLIMEGKKTDDQIFEAVSKKFGLSEDKRRYVAGYRGTLERQGANPPKAK